MQPCYEAKGLSRWTIGGVSVPPLMTQIADGENGGVMMNEFPPKYLEVVRESSGMDTPLMTAPSTWITSSPPESRRRPCPCCSRCSMSL